MTPYDNNDGFIVDDEGKPVDYDDDDEDEYQVEKKTGMEGAIGQYVKNMYAAGGKSKKIQRGVDSNLVKTKESNIKNLISKLDDDDDEDEMETIKLKTEQMPMINPNVHIETYIPTYTPNTNPIAENVNEDIEMKDETKEEPQKIHTIPREIRKVTKPTVNLSSPSPNKRTIRELRTPLTSNQKDITGLGRSVNKTPIVDSKQSETKEEVLLSSNISIRQSTNDVLPTNKDGSVYIYWYDAVEETIQSKPCVIFFGKIYEPKYNSYSSISIVIRNIMRKLYILPKPEYEDKISEVYNEFEQLRQKRFSYIKKFECKPKEKKYCFEMPIDPSRPHTVLKAKYCADFGSLPNNLTGETFSYIFGKTSSLLENIIISRKVKGPCWLRVANYEYGNNFSNTWCKFEITVKDFKSIEVLDEKATHGMSIPPLRIMSISTKTIPSSNGNELFAISCAMKENYHIEDEKGINNVNEYRPLVFVRKIDSKLPGMNTRLNAAINSIEFKQIKNLFGNGNLYYAANEVALLNLFITKLFQCDPDMIVGHNLYSLHLETIMSRINKLKISNWSRIGHFKRDVLPKFLQNANLNNEYIKTCLTGRLICDTFVSTREILLRQTTYSLRYLCEKYLNVNIPELDAGNVISTFSTIAEIEQLLQVTLNEAFYSLVLMDKYMILPLTKQLTCIAGNLWIKSLQSSRASRCEMLLLHEFHDKGYLLPDKYHKGVLEDVDNNEEDDDDDENEGKKNSRNARRKPQYSGGLVLEPYPGLYDQIILLLDFNSLYPSIIQEYNICFTTVLRQPTQSFTNISNQTTEKKKKKKDKAEEENNDEEEQVEEDAEEHVDIKDKVKQIGSKAILPSILEYLVKSRREVKQKQKKEKDQFKNSLLEIRQKALKVSANSLYGYLGYKNSRFYAKEIAALITSTGRRILKNAAAIVQKKHGLNVIYGDTDSVMINTMTQKVSEAVELGYKLKKSINEQYKLLEMDIDGLFKSLLLLKKKKYASLKYIEPYTENSKVVRELKGLDLVRRDWSQLGKDTGSKILDCILSGKSKDDIITDIFDVLKTVSLAIDENKFPINDYAITKQLAKSIDDYTDLKALPHVKVAKRLKEKGDMSIQVNSYIPYVVCLGKDGTASKSIAERSYHPKEIEEDHTLVIDKNWYKENQILSIIRRLVNHIEEISMNQLCECLGIESKHYYASNNNDNDYEATYSNGFDEEIKVGEGITIYCKNCKSTYKINSINSRKNLDKVLMTCPKCKILIDYRVIVNSIIASLKRSVFMYYRRRQSCFKCRDNSSVLFFRMKCPDASCKGVMNREVTEFDVAQEIHFVQKLMESDEKEQGNLQFKKVISVLKTNVEKMYNNVKYYQIDLSELFGFLNK